MKKNSVFKGLITALVTPFKNDDLDFYALEILINSQIAAGVDALVVGGSTGEGNSLEDGEYDELIQTSARIASRRVPIIAGLSAVSTKQLLKKIQRIQEFGVDGFMLTPPHYIRPSQQGIYQHFSMVHDASNLPIMLYSHLGRTGVDFSDDTIIKLSQLPRIVALKDAGSDINRPLRLKSRLPEYFSLLTGNDENAVSFNANGGSGCVSVASNIFPKICVNLQRKCQVLDFKEALILQQSLFPLYEALFLEPNPIGIKYAASLKFKCMPEVRLPLTTALEETRMRIEKVLEKLVD